MSDPLPPPSGRRGRAVPSTLALLLLALATDLALVVLLVPGQSETGGGVSWTEPLLDPTAAPLRSSLLALLAGSTLVVFGIRLRGLLRR